jgi:hypothetical protein
MTKKPSSKISWHCSFKIVFFVWTNIIMRLNSADFFFLRVFLLWDKGWNIIGWTHPDDIVDIFICFVLKLWYNTVYIYILCRSYSLLKYSLLKCTLLQLIAHGQHRVTVGIKEPQPELLWTKSFSFNPSPLSSVKWKRYQNYTCIQETVSRDFRPPVFSWINYPIGPWNTQNNIELCFEFVELVDFKVSRISNCQIVFIRFYVILLA